VAKAKVASKQTHDTFRLPVEVDTWIKRKAATEGKSLSVVMVDAICLYREIGTLANTLVQLLGGVVSGRSSNITGPDDMYVRAMNILVDRDKIYAHDSVRLTFVLPVSLYNWVLDKAAELKTTKSNIYRQAAYSYMTFGTNLKASLFLACRIATRNFSNNESIPKIVEDAIERINGENNAVI